MSFQEGANINKSLTTLGKVISALAEMVSGTHFLLGVVRQRQRLSVRWWETGLWFVHEGLVKRLPTLPARRGESSSVVPPPQHRTFGKATGFEGVFGIAHQPALHAGLLWQEQGGKRVCLRYLGGWLSQTKCQTLDQASGRCSGAQHPSWPVEILGHQMLGKANQRWRSRPSCAG